MALKENVLNRRQFYLLLGVRFGYIIAAYTIPSYYKAYGLALNCEWLCYCCLFSLQVQVDVDPPAPEQLLVAYIV